MLSIPFPDVIVAAPLADGSDGPGGVIYNPRAPAVRVRDDKERQRCGKT